MIVCLPPRCAARFIACVALVAALISAGSRSVAGEAGPYVTIDLGILPGAHNITPLAMNNHGEVVGWTQGPGSLLRAFVWRPGEGISELPTPEGFAYSMATDITDGGLILGRAQLGIVATESRGWIWENGTYTFLPPFPASCTGINASAMNDSREVVGTTCPDAAAESAFFWSPNTGYINLTTQHGLYPAADINEAGVVATGGAGGAARWSQKGGVQFLGTLEAPYDDSARGTAINELNQIAGISEWGVSGPNHWRAFLYRDGVGMQNIAPTGSARAAAWAMNDLGHVVGTMGSESSGDFSSPWLWTPEDGLRFIFAIAPDPTFTGYFGVNDINNAGQIILEAHPADSADPLAFHAIMLSPLRAGDVNRDLIVDVDDLLAVITSWGVCPERPAPCPADISPIGGDAQVDVDDLLMVITDWG